MECIGLQAKFSPPAPCSMPRPEEPALTPWQSWLPRDLGGTWGNGHVHHKVLTGEGGGGVQVWTPRERPRASWPLQSHSQPQGMVVASTSRSKVKGPSGFGAVGEPWKRGFPVTIMLPEALPLVVFQGEGSSTSRQVTA